VWRVDWVLITLVGLLCGIGLVNLRSAALVDDMQHHVTQILWMLIGAGAAAMVATQDPRLAHRWAWVFWSACVLLLLLVPLVGSTNNTAARRWLDLGLFQLQPSEPAKMAVILATARWFHDHESPHPHGLRVLVPPILLALTPALMVMAQPDLGTALTILLIFATMCLFERIRWSALLPLGLASLASLPVLWFLVMNERQKARVLSFLNPADNVQGDAWQVTQSRIAIGSGGFSGRGYLQGTQVQTGFVPEHENDFIFTHHAEQFGWVGGALLIGLYGALILWILRAARLGRDRFSVLLGVGIAAFFFWHVFINLGMVMGALPVVGLWLPFASYGGSAMLTVMVMIGLALAVSWRRIGP
jgi:rod shape determining protein RodA